MTYIEQHEQDSFSKVGKVSGKFDEKTKMSVMVNIMGKCKQYAIFLQFHKTSPNMPDFPHHLDR